jgi:hypothetical protein
VNSACTGNYVLYNGGCVNGQKLGQFTAVNSSFTNNWVSGLLLLYQLCSNAA